MKRCFFNDMKRSHFLHIRCPFTLDVCHSDYLIIISSIEASFSFLLNKKSLGIIYSGTFAHQHGLVGVVTDLLF